MTVHSLHLTQNPLPVTLLYGGLCALLVTLLGARVSQQRIQRKISVKAEVPAEILREVRAHGNAAEWVPMMIVLLAILELSGVRSMALHLLGGSMFIGRLVHAYGMIAKNRNASIPGAAITYLVSAVMSIWAIWLHFA